VVNLFFLALGLGGGGGCLQIGDIWIIPTFGGCLACFFYYYYYSSSAVTPPCLVFLSPPKLLKLQFWNFLGILGWCRQSHSFKLVLLFFWHQSKKNAKHKRKKKILFRNCRLQYLKKCLQMFRKVVYSYKKEMVKTLEWKLFLVFVLKNI